jgi:hypothetical protein
VRILRRRQSGRRFIRIDEWMNEEEEEEGYT